MKKFTADFETATWLENETWVWAWAVCEIGNEENIVIDNNIDSFMDFCKNSKNSTFYFHNLKFDGEFIIYWLLKHGFIHVTNKEDIESGTFTTLISQFGQFYQIIVYFYKDRKHTKKITFIDSYKIIPFAVEDISRSFNLPISKLEIDYNKPRELGHKITEEEKSYITNDVKIVALALNTIFNEGLTRMTEGSNALYDFKRIVTNNKFEHWFPELDYEIDKDIRQAYKGRFYLSKPDLQGKRTSKYYST